MSETETKGNAQSRPAQRPATSSNGSEGSVGSDARKVTSPCLWWEPETSERGLAGRENEIITEYILY